MTFVNLPAAPTIEAFIDLAERRAAELASRVVKVQGYRDVDGVRGFVVLEERK